MTPVAISKQCHEFNIAIMVTWSLIIHKLESSWSTVQDHSIGSLVPRPSRSFSLLTVRKNWGRPGIIYHMSDIKLERRVERTAAWSRLIECSTISCTETEGSHTLAVSSNSRCQECSILTCKRVSIWPVFSEAIIWTAIWTSQLAADKISLALPLSPNFCSCVGEPGNKASWCAESVWREPGLVNDSSANTALEACVDRRAAQW